MLKNISCLLIAFVFCGGYIQAETLENLFMKHVEKNFLQTKVSQEPHWSVTQQARFPVLLVQATQHVRKDLGLTHTDGEDVIWAVYEFLDGYNLLEEKAANEQELLAAQAVSPQNRRHALHFAMVTVLPQEYKKLFPPARYPEVKNWTLFYKWCQIYMDEFYRLMEKLADADKEYLEEIFLIDPD